MPRRRKRKSVLDSRKPKLHFTESPVQVENNPVSPVLGADNPVTAKSVSLEDYSDISWISPNFKQLRSKFQLNGCKRNLRLRKTSSTSSQRHLTSTSTRGSRRLCNDNEINSTAGKRKQNNKCKFKSLIFLQDTNEELESEVHSISVHDSPEPSKQLLLGNESFQGNNVGFHTPVLNKTQIPTPKYLNVTVLDCNKDNLTCLCKSPTPDIQSLKRTIRCPVHQHLNNSRHVLTKTSSIQHSSLLNSFSHNLNDTHSDDYASPNGNLRRSLRLREKYLEAIKLFQCSSPKDTGKNLKILAEDTPESEYNMRLKRRQLRKLVMPW